VEGISLRLPTRDLSGATVHGFFRVDKTKEIITELKKSYAIELETVQNYLANSIDLEGTDAELVRKSLEEEITLKLKHARRLAKRIHILGGRLPGSLALPRNQNLLQPPSDNADMMAVIRGVISANEGSISQYQKIIHLTEGHDYVTQDMVIDLLSDEREHRRLFLSFLTQNA
jgi:bacterioferritin